MADGHPQASQPGQTPSEQRHPTHPLLDRDPVVPERHLDPVLHDVPQGPRVRVAQG